MWGAIGRCDRGPLGETGEQRGSSRRFPWRTRTIAGATLPGSCKAGTAGSREEPREKHTRSEHMETQNQQDEHEQDEHEQAVTPDQGCYVGIDVSKATLDVAVRPSGQAWQSSNDETGIAALVDRLQAVART